ncbi:hypothetical protein CERZMDRAFT_87846 [Cercospora zeae-maydis SCOH1-5]|uniref:Uncharacterized protein n=1 Tax=Cercospora zeae-maydis SCOH1-5 TaxID=717836 RepID=A0A6A6F536_9PEZI|nr:hypothetical protein CERZMDRAFT_87846 [Cercospora zeae-maydis SCOH1-5]
MDCSEWNGSLWATPRILDGTQLAQPSPLSSTARMENVARPPAEQKTELVVRDSTPVDLEQHLDCLSPSYLHKAWSQGPELESRLRQYNNDAELILEELQAVEAELRRLHRQRKYQIRIDMLSLEDAKDTGYSDDEISLEHPHRERQAARDESVWLLYSLEMSLAMLSRIVKSEQWTALRMLWREILPRGTGNPFQSSEGSTSAPWIPLPSHQSCIQENPPPVFTAGQIRSLVMKKNQTVAPA